VTVNAPLHEGTRGLVNAELLKHFKKGAWLVNTARGAICDKDAVAEAIKSGHLNGYAGDVWNVQPAPKDHVWRTMANPLGGGNGMVPHYSGTTLDAQIRYANGTKEILDNYLHDKPQSAWRAVWLRTSRLTCAADPANVIVGKAGYETKACAYLAIDAGRPALTLLQTASAKSRLGRLPCTCTCRTNVYTALLRSANVGVTGIGPVAPRGFLVSFTPHVLILFDRRGYTFT
jgi:hypothetical protein